MQNLFDEVASLDRRCYEEFGLTEDILMEHAADGMADYIRNRFPKGSSVLIATGSGNNGADGITLARLLHRDYDVELYFVKEPKSPMAQLQHERARSIGVPLCDTPKQKYDIVVDAVLGTGFNGEFASGLSKQLQLLNAIEGTKIACDVPSGLRSDGSCETNTFKADVTLTMGALKKSLYLDEAKEMVAEVRVLDLGVARELYERPSNWKVLEYSDLQLPKRTRQNSHKGTYGHTAVIAGEKIGAAVMAAQSALRIGSGLVSVVECMNHSLPYELMRSEHLPATASAIAIGMGLGNVWGEAELDELLHNDLPVVADADILLSSKVVSLLQRKQLVITPHPKEFATLLEILDIAKIDVATLQKKRFHYSELFCSRYPNVTLLLKGANVIIGKHTEFFVNPHGTSRLAKGGSGDVLAGLIAGLLAQGYAPLEAAKNGSLIHTKLASLHAGADFSLTPYDLIEAISKL